MSEIGTGAPFLVIDDEDAVRRVHKRLLEARRIRVRTAASGTEALKLAGEENFSVILADYSMPGLHGDELVARLHEVWPEAKILVVSGVAIDPEQREALRRAGMHLFLPKPLGLIEIEEILSELVG